MQSSNFSNSPLFSDIQRKARAEYKSIRTERAYLKWNKDFLLFHKEKAGGWVHPKDCLLYTSPSPRDRTRSRMPSSA